MVEYALILVLMAIAAIVSITLLGGSVRGLWETIEDLIITALEIR